MSQEPTVQVKTELPAVPAFLKRIPVKKVAVATLLVAAVAAVGVVAQKQIDVEVSTTDETPKA